MMNFDRNIVCSSFKEVSRRGSRTAYSTTLEGQHYIELDVPCMLIVVGRGLVDICVPEELHIEKECTTIVFTKMRGASDAFTRKDFDTLYRYFMQTEGASSGAMGAYGSQYHIDRDTASSGMDAATRMMMGQQRSVRAMAGDNDDDDEGYSLSDMFRMSN